MGHPFARIFPDLGTIEGLSLIHFRVFKRVFSGIMADPRGIQGQFAFVLKTEFLTVFGFCNWRENYASPNIRKSIQFTRKALGYQKRYSERGTPNIARPIL